MHVIMEDILSKVSHLFFKAPAVVDTLLAHVGVFSEGMCFSNVTHQVTTFVVKFCFSFE